MKTTYVTIREVKTAMVEQSENIGGDEASQWRTGAGSIAETGMVYCPVADGIRC